MATEVTVPDPPPPLELIVIVLPAVDKVTLVPAARTKSPVNVLRLVTPELPEPIDGYRMY